MFDIGARGHHLLERQLGVDRDEHLLHLWCPAPAQHELPGGAGGRVRGRGRGRVRVRG